MILHVTKAAYLGDYRIEVWFNDGNHGIADFGEESFFRGPVFGPLKELARFREFIVDPELNTLVWPNGADLAPEFIESRLLVNDHPHQPMSFDK
jgi:hypothetical protein